MRTMKHLILSWMEKLGIPTEGAGLDYIKNTGWVTASKVLESIISYIIIVLISRYLGAEGLGQYSFLFSFAALFFLITDFGLSTLLVNDLSKTTKQINKYVSNIFSFNILAGSVSLLVFVVSLFVMEKNLLVLGIIVGFVQLLTVFRLMPLGVLRVFHEGRSITVVNVIERVLALAGAIVAMAVFNSLFWFLFSLFIAGLLRLLLTYIFAKKHFTISLSIDWSFLWPTIKKALPFLLIAAFTFVYVQLDTVMLSFMKGDVVVGWYNASYRIINIISLLPALLLTFGFPLFSKYYSKNKQLLISLFEKILLSSLAVVIPIIAGVFLIGDRILDFIYQFNAIEGFIAFKILIVAELFIFLTFIMGNLISAANKQNMFAKIAGLGALFNIILNFILIPKYSLYGAAFATLLTYFLMFVIMHFFIRKNIIKYNLFKNLPVIASATGVMVSVVLQVMHWWLPWILLVAIMAYFLVFFLLLWMQDRLR